jgi:small subunit ribosomal protein S9
MVKKINYIYTVGRRKSASARVRLFHGKGENTANGLAFDKYFTVPNSSVKWEKAFGLTETTGKYYVSVKVTGGGKISQLEATVQGIARALAKVKADFRTPLKKAGLLTRDSRIRERRKIGMGGKSRRKKQSPKR